MNGNIDPDSDSWQLYCVECHGVGCQVCAGRGFKRITVKPLDFVSNDGFHLFSAYKWLKNYSIFPIADGLEKQSVKFVRAVEFMDIVNNATIKNKEESKTDKAREIENMASMLKGKNAGS